MAIAERESQLQPHVRLADGTMRDSLPHAIVAIELRFRQPQAGDPNTRIGVVERRDDIFRLQQPQGIQR